MPRQAAEPSNGPGQRGNTVIENTMAILRCFAPDRQELGVTEIAAQVGLHKSTVSRVLTALEHEGIVEQRASRRYRLGLGIISVAGPLLADLDVRRAAYPVLVELTESTKETTALMVWNGVEAVTVEQIPSPQQVKHTSSLGSRYQTAHSASVQVFLAEATAEAMRELVDAKRLSGIDQDSDLDTYATRLRANGERGYTVNNAETSPDEVGIAAPVRDHRGAVVAAVLIAAPKYRTDETAIARMGEACTRAAREITARLGGAQSSTSSSI